MENIPLPSVIKFSVGDKPNLGTLTVEPLFPGYGTTLGNSLRRVLLSSLPGAAVMAIKVADMPHEFTTIPKVQEDILQIIMNFKLLRLKVFSAEPVKLHISAKGQKVVTAKDIEKNSDVEIINEDLVIATLTSKDAEIEMDIWVGQGRGYSSAESREKEKGEIGKIAVDAFYSPVCRVAMSIESARVGQMTNFDKLVMDIETDGTISCEDAVMAAAQILVDHFSLIGRLESISDAGLEKSTATTDEKTAGQSLGDDGEDQEAVALDKESQSEDSVVEPKRKKSSKKKA